MGFDVELIRVLMLILEGRQLSPRSTIVLSLDEEAEELGRDAVEIGVCLNALLDLDYIDGPGDDEPGFWLFRKLTRKGIMFVDEVRTPRDWDRVKQRYGRIDANPAR